MQLKCIDCEGITDVSDEKIVRNAKEKIIYLYWICGVCVEISIKLK